MADYPALFKKLNWWQHIHFNEIPKYIKKKDSDIIFKVDGWRTNPNTADISGFYVEHAAYVLFIEDVLPASQEDYDNFLKQNNVE